MNAPGVSQFGGLVRKVRWSAAMPARTPAYGRQRGRVTEKPITPAPPSRYTTQLCPVMRAASRAGAASAAARGYGRMTSTFVGEHAPRPGTRRPAALQPESHGTPPSWLMRRVYQPKIYRRDHHAACGQAHAMRLVKPATIFAGGRPSGCADRRFTLQPSLVGVTMNLSLMPVLGHNPDAVTVLPTRHGPPLEPRRRKHIRLRRRAIGESSDLVVPDRVGQFKPC
jgi:hypothetical protein